jgi:hypothetical protein
MDRKSRIFMYFSFAFINFVFFRGVGMHVLGLVFLILGVWQLMTKPKLG